MKIETGTFNGLSSLEWLFLEENKLHIFPLNELWNVPKLKLLKLGHNRLTMKNETFPLLANIYELYVLVVYYLLRL